MLDLFFDTVLGIGLARTFSFQAVIRKEGNTLTARTGLPAQLLLLFAASRWLILDPQQKAVRIRDRSFWFFTRWHRIPFDAVEAVVYTYTDMSPGQFNPFGAYRSLDVFTVGLRMRHGEERRLFRFVGEGGFNNDGILPDWCYWEENLVTPLVQGSQDTGSRLFADVVSRMTGAPIVNA